MSTRKGTSPEQRLRDHAARAHGLTTTINDGQPLPDETIARRHASDHSVAGWAHAADDLYLFIEEDEGDPLSPARGILIGLVIGAGLWAVAILIATWLVTR